MIVFINTMMYTTTKTDGRKKARIVSCMSISELQMAVPVFYSILSSSCESSSVVL